MPDNQTPLCKQNPIRQISNASDSNDRVNRDLEQIYAALNRVIRCQGNMADAVDGLSNGSFAGGDGTGTAPGSSGGTQAGSQQQQGQPLYRYGTGTDFTLPDGFTGVALIAPTADIAVTLPAPVPGFPITVMHVGTTHVITIKTDLGAAIAPTIMHGGWMPNTPVEDASYAVAWNTKAVVFYPSGAVVLGGILSIENPDGLNIKSPNGNYHKITVSNADVIASSDLSSTDPTIG